MSDFVGWVKYHRKILNWQWYADLNTRSLFLHLLLIVNREPKNWLDNTIMPGQLATGINSLSLTSGLSIQNIRTSLKKLKSTNEITIKKTNKYSIITIVNWNDYQESNNQINKPLTNDQQTTNKQLTTTKEDKKIRKEESILFALTSEDEKPIALQNKKGGRLAIDWELPEEWGDWAVNEFKMTFEEIVLEGDKFKDYWLSRADKGAVKKDWYAVWRNWIRSTIERKNNVVQRQKKF